MRKLVLACVTAALTTLVTTHAHAQLALANPGFETPQLGDGKFQYGPDIAGASWTFDAGSGISANNSGFTNFTDPAPEGTQVALLQGMGSFSQDISLTAGTYTLSFEAAQRGGTNSNDGTSYGGNDFQVSLGGLVLDTFLPTTTSYDTFTTSFTVATDNTYTLAFTGLDTATGDHTAFVDNVQLSAVPEPSTWAMLSLGVAGLGVVTLRRRSAAS